MKKVVNENLNFELFAKYEKEIRKELYDKSPVRYWHSISVAITAVNLSSIYNVDADDCLVAGLLHDYCKYANKEKRIALCEKYGLKMTEEDKKSDGCIHGFLGSVVCKKKFKINDKVKNAIYYHTCGRPNMTNLEKIIYIADFIEPIRKFRDKVKHIRKLAFSDIDTAIVKAAEMNLLYLKKHNMFIHGNTIKTLNYYKKKVEKRKSKNSK